MSKRVEIRNVLTNLDLKEELVNLFVDLEQYSILSRIFLLYTFTTNFHKM